MCGQVVILIGNENDEILEKKALLFRIAKFSHFCKGSTEVVKTERYGCCVICDCMIFVFFLMRQHLVKVN